MNDRMMLPRTGVLAVSLLLLACSGGSGGENGSGGASATGGGTATGGTATGGATGGQATGGAPGATGGATTGGKTGGNTGGQAGAPATGGATGGNRTGGSGQGGNTTGGATDGGVATGGVPGDGGTTSSCTGKAWGTADPSAAGPFKVVKETNVGPMAGQPDPKYNNTVPKFYVYRPMEMATSGYCHPVVIWSNGHGDQPSTYEVLLNNLASHGFVVVASLSSIPSQGTPLPAVTGAQWIAAQNDDPASEFYHHLDTAHIGASGHSEGGAATTKAASDPHITAIATVSGAGANPGIHGPALLFCGEKDTVVPCSNIMTTYSSIKDQPAMLADNLSADHGSWLYQSGTKGVDITAITGWMRVHLMGDTANRKMFYGASCTLCTDTRVKVMQNSFLTQ
jgi:hypothetical protein